MAKRARRSLPESHYQQLVRKYRCIPIRELSFGGPKLDLVGFSLKRQCHFGCTTAHGHRKGYCQVKQFGGILAARRHR